MSRMICLPSLPVKPTRRTPRSSSSFGTGILRSLPFAGRMPYTAQDLADAAAMFADDATQEPDWDALAAQRAWEDAYEAGHCLACGDRTPFLTEQGLCDRCDEIACETSTTQRAR
jgi:hypothetical protein